MTNNKDIKFGTLLVMLEKNPNLVVFSGIRDSLSIKANEIVKNFFKDSTQEVLYLNYDENKSLMLDLNIRKIPVVIIFKNMEIDRLLYMPNLQQELENYYGNLRHTSKNS